MPFDLFFDTETTGLPDWKVPSDSEHQPHIVQLAALKVDRNTREVRQTLDVIVRPDGWQITPENAEIHGITDEMAEAEGVDEVAAVNMLLELWGGCRRIAYNRTFDQRIIRIAMKRYGWEDVALEDWGAKEDFEDPMLMAKPIMQLPPYGKYGWKSPKLEAAYEYFLNASFDGAHSALADARATMELYYAILDSEQQEKEPAE